MSGVFGLLIVALWILTAVALIPRLGKTTLDRIGWRRLPVVGRLSGVAAALILFLASIPVAAIGSAFAPPTPSPAARATTAAPVTPTIPIPTPTPTATSTATAAAAPSAIATAPACAGKDPTANVYHPDRLVLLDLCKTAIGTVQLTRREDDGDWHIQLRLDAGQETLLNAKNASDQAGALVLEIICANTVTQADAVSACASYTNPVPVPAVGARISATGPFVLDTAHGWNEIHPVWSITILAGTIPSPVPTIATTPAPTVAPTAAVTSAPTPAPTVAPTSAPTAAPTTAPALSVTITASRYGYVAASTLAGASCTARARLPSGNFSTAQGLAVTAVADGYGAVSWTYGTSSTTTPGTGTHTVTCTLSGATATASAPFTVP